MAVLEFSEGNLGIDPTTAAVGGQMLEDPGEEMAEVVYGAPSRHGFESESCEIVDAQFAKRSDVNAVVVGGGYAMRAAIDVQAQRVSRENRV